MRRYRGTDLARRYRRSAISPTSWCSDWLVADSTQCALRVNYVQDARRCKLGAVEGELGRGDSNAVLSPPSIHTQLLHYRLTYICMRGVCTQGCSSRQPATDQWPVGRHSSWHHLSVEWVTISWYHRGLCHDIATHQISTIRALNHTNIRIHAHTTPTQYPRLPFRLVS